MPMVVRPRAALVRRPVPVSSLPMGKTIVSGPGQYLLMRNLPIGGMLPTYSRSLPKFPMCSVKGLSGSRDLSFSSFRTVVLLVASAAMP
jgi:hypothetical protein